jgi:hypothetical protein
MFVTWRHHPRIHRDAGPRSVRRADHRDHRRRLPSARNCPSSRTLPARCPGQRSNLPYGPMPGSGRAPPTRSTRRLPMDHSGEQRRGGSCCRADPASGTTYRSDGRRLPSKIPRPSHPELRSCLLERNGHAVGSARRCRWLIWPSRQGTFANARLRPALNHSERRSGDIHGCLPDPQPLGRQGA